MSPRRRAVVVGMVVVLLVAVTAGVLGVVRVLGPRVDPTARPAQDRPGPVLLVPGYGGSRQALAGLAGRIAGTGRDVTVLTAPGDGRGDLAEQVRVLDAAVDAALAAGAPSVDVVGYSAGGVVAGLWVARDDGAAKARRVVTLGSPLGGTDLAAAGVALGPDVCPPACRQLATGSAEVAELARAGVGSAVPWLSVWTRDDDTATPPETAAALAGTRAVAVQDVCPGVVVAHGELPSDPVSVGLVLGALAPGPLGETGDCAGVLAAAG